MHILNTLCMSTYSKEKKIDTTLNTFHVFVSLLNVYRDKNIITYFCNDKKITAFLFEITYKTISCKCTIN